jgi:hypothetical protein
VPGERRCLRHTARCRYEHMGDTLGTVTDLLAQQGAHPMRVQVYRRVAETARTLVTRCAYAGQFVR